MSVIVQITRVWTTNSNVRQNLQVEPKATVFHLTSDAMASLIALEPRMKEIVQKLFVPKITSCVLEVENAFLRSGFVMGNEIVMMDRMNLTIV